MTGVFDTATVVPVVVIDDVASAVPVARALIDGGVHIIEVTLRSGAAFDAIRLIADEVPDMIVGAGTVRSCDQVKAASAAGAQFLVSPGCTDHLLDTLEGAGLPFLAGSATPSDMMRLLERGITQAKLFPAVAVGGVALLKAVYGPLPELRFCPTGGITPTSASEFLSLPNVMCVGGTWLTPADRVAAGDWPAITDLARAAAHLTY